MKIYAHAPWVPQALEPTLDIAYNFWWNTDAQARRFFYRMAPGLWHRVNHNPVMLLRSMTKEQLIALSGQPEICEEMMEIHDRMRRDLTGDGRFQFERTVRGTAALHVDPNPMVAYFSAEFGMHQSLPIYSGGLGILAGDHVRSASDLGLPLVGVGLLYRQGYFHQRFSLDNWQEEHFDEHGCHNLPIKLIEQDDGNPLLVSVRLPNREVKLRLWLAQVGRTSLILMDSYLKENWHEDRDITSRLYDADRDIRLRQEIVLGVGGVRALLALGIHPRKFHMNEGHSAFLVLERCATVMADEGLGFHEARERLKPSNIFTTHTPVSAGHEVFRRELMEPYFMPQLEKLKLSADEFFELGHRTGTEHNGDFEMTSLAIRFSGAMNGVSKLHGEVSRKQWHCMWPDVSEEEVPIGHVTNGIHTGVWVGPEMRRVFSHYLSPDWASRVEDRDMWDKVNDIPSEDLWEARRRQRRRLLDEVVRRAEQQLIGRNVDRDTLLHRITGLDPEALTIGFARRFATYKRATLLFAHLDRLKALVGNSERPVQIILAGKAHPADDGGKRLLQEVIEYTNHDELFGRVVLLEDYDIGVARRLVQGSDVWLNTPRPPKEASGTSGMKVCPNGGLTLSTKDGWWVEGASHLNGWTIGEGWSDRPEHEVDEEDAANLIEILEKEIVPLFYERDENNLPQAWLSRVRESIRTVTPFFTTRRMVREYAEKYYR